MSTSSPHPATLSPDDLLRDCEVVRQRRSGPGGQHRNKVSTAIRLKHRPSGITAEATERRAQSENLSAAVRRLRISLAIDVRRRPGRTPSALWQQRCQRGLVRVNPGHADFPSLLAEALDVLQESAWEVTIAASRLGCTASQLVKLLRHEHRAMTLLSQQRRAVGLPPLK